MPYCVECGAKIEKNDDFCPECGKKTKHKEKEEKIRIIEKEIPVIKEMPRRRHGLIAFIIIFIILLIVFLVLIQSGELEKIFKGSVCEKEFQDCNHDCGEGWGSGLCKTLCTNQYNKCKSG